MDPGLEEFSGGCAESLCLLFVVFVQAASEFTPELFLAGGLSGVGFRLQCGCLFCRLRSLLRLGAR
jgi:hypothetical protein